MVVSKSFREGKQTVLGIRCDVPSILFSLFRRWALEKDLPQTGGSAKAFISSLRPWRLQWHLYWHRAYDSQVPVCPWSLWHLGGLKWGLVFPSSELKIARHTLGSLIAKRTTSATTSAFLESPLLEQATDIFSPWPLAVYLRPTRQWRKRREWSWFWGGGRGVTPFLLEPNVYTPENQCLAKKPPKLYRFFKMICSAVFVSGALFRPCLLQISLGGVACLGNIMNFDVCN